MSTTVNLDEELSPARWKCNLNQEKTIIWGENLEVKMEKANKNDSLPWSCSDKTMWL